MRCFECAVVVCLWLATLAATGACAFGSGPEATPEAGTDAAFEGEVPEEAAQPVSASDGAGFEEGGADDAAYLFGGGCGTPVQGDQHIETVGSR
jgi:hypothetical protein